MTKIYLDDERKTPIGWLRAYSYIECIVLLKAFNPTHLSLDHDLGSDKTGYDVIKWIENKVYSYSSYHPPIITVHSANPVGRNNIELTLLSIEKMLNSR